MPTPDMKVIRAAAHLMRSELKKNEKPSPEKLRALFGAAVTRVEKQALEAKVRARASRRR